MSLNLVKGQGMGLIKENPNLEILEFGLGWRPQQFVGQKFDLDASFIAFDAQGKSREEWMLYYDTKTTTQFEGKEWKSILNGIVLHSGDDKTGGSSADSDDEKIIVNLKRLAQEFPEIVGFSIPTTIYEADTRGGQNFGQVDGAYITARNHLTGVEIGSYRLTSDSTLSVVDALVFGEAKFEGGDWNFRAVGQGFKGGDYGLIPLMLRYGLPIQSHPLIDPIVEKFKKEMGIS